MEVNFFDSFNNYCGPAVLSIFTGARADDCAEEIQKVNHAFKVKGVYAHDLIAAGTNMGLSFEEIPAFEQRSIFWTASALIRMPSARYLVTVPHHYVALETKDGSVFICDNHTKTELELQNSARLSQKVNNVWKVTKVREYSRPVPVKTEYAVERIATEVLLSCIQIMSDGGIKKIPLGRFQIPNPAALQEIAFKLMELTDKEK